MRNLVAAGAVTLAAALVACGGGSASPPAFNTGRAAPSPTPSPTPPVVFALRWTGATHSTRPSAASRSVLDTATTTEPIELAVGAPGSLVRQSGAVFGTLQVTATVAGSPAPVPVPSPGAVTIGNSALATTNQAPAPSASPTAGPLNVADVQSASTTGSTTVSVRMPSGDVPSAAVNVYSGFAMECPSIPGLHPDAVQAYKVAGGALVAATGAVDGDVYFCSAPTLTIVHFPYGYVTYLNSTPFSSITTALPFASLGTTVDVYSLQAQATAVTNPIGGFIFKTAAGDYVKVRMAAIGGTPNFVIAGAAAVGPGGMFSL